MIATVMFVRCLLLLALTSGVTSLSLREMSHEWNLFKLKFNRTFTSGDEETYRYTVFVENLKKIHRHNMAADKGRYSYWLGVNNFADLTDKEFEEKFTGLKVKATPGSPKVEWTTTKSYNLSWVPREIDWRDKKCVTQVKFQKTCRSCYAFAATGALESHHCIKTGKLVSLSEQNIIDCTDNDLYGNMGCKGGHTDGAFEYAEEKGIDTEKSYPYVGQDGKCRFNKKTVGAKAKAFEDLFPRKEHELQRVVAKMGPIAVCIDSRGLKLYDKLSGVYDGKYEDKEGAVHMCSCEVNHALLLVGYGTARDGRDYWLLKNSWGEDWGIDGYLKLIRNYKNTCGIASYASYPII